MSSLRLYRIILKKNKAVIFIIVLCLCGWKFGRKYVGDSGENLEAEEREHRHIFKRSELFRNESSLNVYKRRNISESVNKKRQFKSKLQKKKDVLICNMENMYNKFLVNSTMVTNHNGNSDLYIQSKLSCKQNLDIFQYRFSSYSIVPYLDFLGPGVKLHKCVVNFIKWSKPNKCYTYSKLDLVTLTQIKNKMPFTVHGSSLDFYKMSCSINRDRKGNIAAKASHVRDVHRRKYDPHALLKGEKTELYEQFMLNVVKQEDGRRSVKIRKEMFKNKTAGYSHDKSQMNVLIFSLESMSQPEFKRKLPHTYSYLKHNLNSHIFNGYNIGGRDSVVPIMTGMSEEDALKVLSIPSTHISPIWEDYRQQGYVPMWADNKYDMDELHMELSGVSQIDHHTIPFWQAVHDHQNTPHKAQNHTASNSNCVGGSEKYKLHLKFITQFFDVYKSYPKFAYASYDPALDDVKKEENPGDILYTMDKSIQTFLQTMVRTKQFENTVLLVTSNTGPRYSSQRSSITGKLEERLPFLSVTIPAELRTAHPSFYHNLVENSKNRLVTAYDVHKTLVDLLHIGQTALNVDIQDRVQAKLGRSLFREIPSNRTCQSEGISAHYCACVHYKAVMHADRTIVKGAEFITSQLNSYISSVNLEKVCEQVRLEAVVDSQIIKPLQGQSEQPVVTGNGYVDNNNKSHSVSHYQITIMTLPGHSLYEATVLYHRHLDSWTMEAPISGITPKHSKCLTALKHVNHHQIKDYCYCEQ